MLSLRPGVKCVYCNCIVIAGNTTVQCVCGTVYCNTPCCWSDVNHSLICNADFHLKIRNLINMVFQRKASTISLPTITFQGSLFQQPFKFATFPWLCSHGCILCGNDATGCTNFTSVPDTHITTYRCKRCVVLLNSICRHSHLPLEKCFTRAMERIFAQYLNMRVLNIPSDIYIYLLSYVFHVNDDITRLRSIGMNWCDCK